MTKNGVIGQGELTKWATYPCMLRRCQEEEGSEDGCLQATMKHSAFASCIADNGIGDLIRIDGVLNAKKYK